MISSAGYFDEKSLKMKEIQEIAGLHNIPITVEEDDVVEGWVGKPKGQRQILWERGLLDPAITYVTKLKTKLPSCKV